MNNHGLDLLHRPDLPAVIARWHREVTPAELRLGYEAVLAAADEAACARWLLDLRRRQDLTEPALTAWFSHEFVPSLRGRYPESVRIAFLISPLRTSQAVTTVASDTACEFASFTDEAAAHAWLGRMDNGY
ncbi:MAG: hypothetical protein ACRYFX_04480 [Janthinobacterium lividum]